MTDHTDHERSLAVARSWTANDAEARLLIAEAEGYAQTLATEGFERRVRHVAAALLEAGELDGNTVTRLIEEADRGEDPAAA